MKHSVSPRGFHFVTLVFMDEKSLVFAENPWKADVTFTDTEQTQTANE